MKMEGLYLAVLIDLGWFPLRSLLQFPRLYSPAIYAQLSGLESGGQMNQKRRTISQVAIGILLLCGCVSPASVGEASSLNNRSAGNHMLSITVGGLKRRYVVHVPPGYGHKTHWPVVIMFHGGGGNAKAAMCQSGFTVKAGQEDV